MICCTLFMPQGVQEQKRNDMADTVRVASMTLAITGITNPVSQIQNLASAETATLRSSSPRSGVSLAGKRSNFSSPAKRNSLLWLSLDDDSSPAVLPVTPPLPSFYPRAQESHTCCILLPEESHGHIHWFALAPPTSFSA